jgi:putative ABC transport system permease protein
MRGLRAFMARVAGLLGKGARDRDLDDEFASHVEMDVEARVRKGMTRDAARRAALLASGSLESAKEAYRDRRSLAWAAALIQDLRYGGRVLRRNPGFTLAAALSLALGIGANTAIFSILDSLLLRSLPVRAPGELVQIFSTGSRVNWTNPLWEQLRSRPDLFAGTTAFSMQNIDLAARGQADVVTSLWASGRFFEVLGVPPMLGRTFTEADDVRGGGPDGAVAVLSESFWRRRFGADPSVIGRRLNLDQVPYTIIGVTPAGFTGPRIGESFDVAIPIGTEPLIKGEQSSLDVRSAWWLRVFARLKPGQTLAFAASALEGIRPQVREATLPTDFRPQDLPGYLARPMTVVPAGDGGQSYLREDYRTPLLAAMVVVGLVLLIACVNLANLLLARADARAHELTVRLAIGASRGRLIRQLLVESLLISSLGAVVALAFARWSSALLVAQLSTFSTPITLDLSLDWRVLAFTSGVAVAVSFLFGTAPAFRATRVEASDVLRDRGRGSSGSLRWGVGSVLLVFQAAMCLALVFGAGLFGRTFYALASRHLGFDADRVLVVEMELPTTDTRSDDARLATFAEVRDAVATLPGVENAALASLTPLGDSQWQTTIENLGGSMPEADRQVDVNAVGPGFFATMGTRLERGRDFDDRDRGGEPAAIVVNEAFAQMFFAGSTPLGRTVTEVHRPGSPAIARTIVGVVENAVYDSIRANAPPTVYRALRQQKDTATEMSLTVRAARGSPLGLVASVGAAVSRTAPGLSFRTRPLSTQVAATMVRERTMALLSVFFGVLALVLAGLGLYGVVSYAVGRRRVELGIRLALGARPTRVVALIVSRVALLVACGIAAGVLISLWAAKFASTLLFGLPARDITTMAGASLILAAVGLLASWLPVWRASRLDVARVLREG